MTGHNFIIGTNTPYTSYRSYPIIEYRAHWGKNGNSYDIEFFDGKDWRQARALVSKCEAGTDERDNNGYSIQWIERVERWHDQHGEYMEDEDYEIMWEREVSE